MTIFGVSYFMGMIWYIICDLRRISSFVELNRPEEISFVTNYFDEKDKTNSQRAVEIMYYAFTSLSTVGFGDFHPLNSFERLVCAIILIFGNAIFGYIIGIFKDMIV